MSSYPFPVFVEEARGIRDFGGSRGDVRIGSDVWLASGCTILSGVTVGNGAVVAARAVVTRDVAPYSDVAGNAARHVRYRFDQEVRDALLESAWWNWPEAEARKIVPLLCSGDPAPFLAYAEVKKPGAYLKSRARSARIRPWPIQDYPAIRISARRVFPFQ